VHLPEWDDLTEYMKLQVGAMATITFRGYSFTSEIHPAQLAKWVARGTVHDRVVERLQDELRARGFSGLPLAFVLEGRSKSGKSRTKIHVHGFVIPDTPHEMTRFKLAVIDAWHTARGESKLLEKRAWDAEPAYDKDTGDGRGWGRWVGYLVKNARRYDARIKGRRVYISQSMTQVAREFWWMLQEKPV
jgi:hypothetical protein